MKILVYYLGTDPNTNWESEAVERDVEKKRTELVTQFPQLKNQILIIPLYQKGAEDRIEMIDMTPAPISYLYPNNPNPYYPPTITTPPVGPYYSNPITTGTTSTTGFRTTVGGG